MKKNIYHRNQLLIESFASKNETLQRMNGVYLDSGKAYATDCHRLAIAEKLADPPSPWLVTEHEAASPALIALDSIKETLRKSKMKKRDWSCLEQDYIAYENNGNGPELLANLHKDRFKVNTVPMPPPDYSKIVKIADSQDYVTLNVDPKYLKEACDIALKVIDRDKYEGRGINISIPLIDLRDRKTASEHGVNHLATYFRYCFMRINFEDKNHSTKYDIIICPINE